MRSVKQRFGQRVRELRQAKGWSQERMAEECGLHRTYMGGVERGERNVSLVNVERIANALGLPISALFIDDRFASPARRARTVDGLKNRRARP